MANLNRGNYLLDDCKGFKKFLLALGWKLLPYKVTEAPGACWFLQSTTEELNLCVP